MLPAIDHCPLFVVVLLLPAIGFLVVVAFILLLLLLVVVVVVVLLLLVAIPIQRRCRCIIVVVVILVENEPIVLVINLGGFLLGELSKHTVVQTAIIHTTTTAFVRNNVAFVQSCIQVSRWSRRILLSSSSTTAAPTTINVFGIILVAVFVFSFRR